LPNIKCYPIIYLETEENHERLSHVVSRPKNYGGILSSSGITQSGKFEINSNGA